MEVDIQMVNTEKGSNAILALVAVVALVLGAVGGAALFSETTVERVEIPGPVVEKEVVKTVDVEVPVLTEAVEVDGKTYGPSEVSDLLDKLDGRSSSEDGLSALSAIRERAEEDIVEEIQDKHDVCGGEDYDDDEISVDFDDKYTVVVKENGDLVLKLSGDVDYDDECDDDFTAEVDYDESRDDLDSDVTF